ncbi:terpenoid synthase [Penicillium herquei]|nr:terpenoid synthase [Penicillium herquei]
MIREDDFSDDLAVTAHGITSGNLLHGDALTLVNELRGKEFHIPPIWKVLSGWPVARSSHYKAVQRYADLILDKYVSGSNLKKLKALKESDMGGLVAFWYPLSDLPELEMMTAFLIWIFVWDDEVDTSETLISSDAQRVRAYSEQSMRYIRQELGLLSESETEKAIADSDAPITIDQIYPNMSMFSEVGRPLRSGADIAQRERFYNELVNYIICVEDEHSFRLRGTIPSTKDYMRLRVGSVASRAFVLLIDFMLRYRVPDTIIDTAPMQSLWNESTTLSYLFNDLYSVQKELAEGSVLNMVPVLYWNDQHGLQTPSLKKVTGDIMKIVRESMEAFEAAAESLEASTRGDAQLSSQIASFIEGCRYFTTGQIAWYCETSRYGMAELLDKDGSADFVL